MNQKIKQFLVLAAAASMAIVSAAHARPTLKAQVTVGLGPLNPGDGIQVALSMSNITSPAAGFRSTACCTRA